MSIQDQIAADEAAISAAQSQLDAAKSQLDKDKFALEAVQPHLSVLSEIETFAVHVEEAMRDDFKAIVTRAKGLF